MRTEKIRIDKATYKQLRKLKYTDLYEEIQVREFLPREYFIAYGVYNVQLKEYGGGEYYIECSVGTSCD